MNIHARNTVGEPDLLESLIPVWGSGRESVNHFQQGNYGKGLLWGAMAASDIFLVKAVVISGIKLVGRAGTSLALKGSTSVAVRATPSAVANTTGTVTARSAKAASPMSIMKMPNTAKQLTKHAIQGSYRPFGNTSHLLKNKGIQYTWKNMFWDSRNFKAVSQQYWRVSNGAKGSALHHLWFENQYKWIPEGIRNAGLNLLEIPAGLNTWMGGRPMREWMFRVGVSSLMTSTFKASYIGTNSLMKWMTDEEDQSHEAFDTP